MLKIVRFIGGGLDVHKNVIVATIGSINRHNNITTYIQESFSTLNSDLYRLRDWLISHRCFDVCMESTGKYWIPVFNVLEEHIHVCLTHPKYVICTSNANKNQIVIMDKNIIEPRYEKDIR